MGSQFLSKHWKAYNQLKDSKMKAFVVCALFALAAAKPEAEAEADAQMFYNRYGYWPQNYMQGYGPYMNGGNWMQSYGNFWPGYQQYSYGHAMYKREAEAEAQPEADAEAMFYSNWPQMYNNNWQQGYSNGPWNQNMMMNNMYMKSPMGQYNMNYQMGQYNNMNYHQMGQQYMNNYPMNHGMMKRDAEADAEPAYFYNNYYNNGYFPQNYMYNRYMNGWRSYNSYPYRYSFGYGF